MKNLIAIAILAFSTSAFAQLDKTLMYCDFYTPNHVADIYIDVYLDFDAATDSYSNIEAGILKAETDAYPDYLWTLTSTYAQGSSVATITIEKDLDTLTFDFPTTGAGANAVFAIPKSAGKITDFEIPVKGTYAGTDVDQKFLCYDPSTKETR